MADHLRVPIVKLLWVLLFVSTACYGQTLPKYPVSSERYDAAEVSRLCNGAETCSIWSGNTLRIITPARDPTNSLHSRELQKAPPTYPEPAKPVQRPEIKRRDK